MASTELLLILLVALVAFGPKKLPLLATNLGKLARSFILFKKKVAIFIETQSKELDLWENKQKAEEADEKYKNKTEV